MKYSILIPAYKAKFLKECINSILEQTFQDFELIILNDCSPENIRQIVDCCIAQKGSDKIRYYENKINIGAERVVDNWNKLLSLAKGDYCICLGDDDRLSQDCLEEYNNLMSKHPKLDCYHARSLIINEHSQTCDIQEERPEKESAMSMIWHRTFKSRIQFIGDYCFRISSLRKRGGFYYLPLAWESDCITSYEAASEFGIANTNKPIFLYRKNAHSITSSRNTILKMKATLLYETWLVKYLQTKSSNAQDELYRSLLIKNVGQVLKHNKIYMIADEISHKLTSSIFWYIHRKEYGITWVGIIQAVIIGLGLKYNKQ